MLKNTKYFCINIRMLLLARPGLPGLLSAANGGKLLPALEAGIQYPVLKPIGAARSGAAPAGARSA